MLSCVYLSNVNCKVMTVPVKVMTASLNFGQHLQSMFTKIKLNITRAGGGRGELLRGKGD